MASTVTSTNNLSLRSILEKDKLTGSNFLDWERNLMIVLRHERKWYVLEEPLGEAPPANAPAAARNAHKKHSDDLLDVACLMLATMSPDLQTGLINTNAYDMIRQLRDMFQTQARTERYDATKAFNECKMVKGTSVSDHVMKMKRHLDHLERLGHPVPLQLATDTILNSLSEDYRPFVVNYNMNNMEKTVAELHSMLKTAELNMGNKNKTKDVLMVKDGGIKKKNGHASTSKGKGPVQAIQSAPKKGKGKGKGKKVKPNKARTENRCFICNEIGRNHSSTQQLRKVAVLHIQELEVSPGSYDHLLNNSYKCCRLKVAQIFDRVANIGRDPRLRLLLGKVLLEERSLVDHWWIITQAIQDTHKNPTKLTYYPPVVTELGTRRAIIPDDLVQKQANEWVLTLAGYFIGKRPAFPFVQYHARRMWKKYGLTDVILNDQGYFFFKFNSDQGLNFVFENGPWLFNGMPIFIQRWQPGLCFDKPDLQTVPLWVNIYGLPLDVWDYEIISRIASVVGEPVSVDRYTDEMCETKSGRANFARVLVNVSADYELPSYIDAIILGKLRKFKTEFLWKPKRCSHCKVFGHDFEGCVIRPRTTDEVKKVNHVVGESSTPKDDGFNFPKRKKKPKPTVDPLKVGPKVAVKINQRYVPKVILPTTDPLDKGKTKLNNDIPSPKAPIFKTERTPMPVKVSNQFTVLEEHPKWTADKKEVDCYVEKRGVGLEPVIINSWSRQKLDYFIDRWERVFGKEPDGKLRGFTLPDRIDVGDDDDDVTSDDDVLSDHDTLMNTRPKKVSWSDRQVSTKMEQDMQ
ncbi:hypothetical protein OSB04_012696 [Centaurea solstitialis]|uniref:DUF4283 domain-containing protein n=1 Tax=Centaurea solstitialis TaxID=347529 RepID=A0AA38WE81_9ASTR|nr:hypothetical protein OSB04_012696 [Centaurea solstitialis]